MLTDPLGKGLWIAWFRFSFKDHLQKFLSWIQRLECLPQVDVDGPKRRKVFVDILEYGSRDLLKLVTKVYA